MTRAASPIAFVGGSGIDLNELFDEISQTVPFERFPGLETSSIIGHPSTFVSGVCAGYPIIVQSGRRHFYEGLTYPEVVRPVDVLHELGVRRIVFTNAAGGLLFGMHPGDLLAVDKVKLARYQAWSDTPGVLFPNFIVPGCDFTGTLQWVHGPNYETPAEIAFFQSQRASVIGMSTAPELQRCQELGIQAGIVSCVTNSCCPTRPLAHDHVVAIAARTSHKLVTLLRSSLPEIAR